MLLLLFDLSAFVHRNHHIWPTTAGRLAVEQIAKIIERHQPTHVACACDLPWPTWRHELCARHATRYKPPERRTGGAERASIMGEMHVAETLCEDVLGVRCFGARAFEADDVIATLAARFDGDVLIACRDKDFNQLVSARVSLLDFKTGAVTRPTHVLERYGFAPERFVEWLALVGDKSDGFPGCPGIGPKAALDVIRELPDLDAVGALTIDEETSSGLPRAVRRRLVEGAATMRLSRTLATLRTDAPLRLSATLDELRALPLPDGLL